MSCCQLRVRIAAIGTALALGLPGFGGEPLRWLYHPAEQTGQLQCRDVHESSGIAISRATEGVFWTHNDSGDRPRLFAFQIDGTHVGSWAVPGAQARDWEDIASFTRNQQPLLLIADTGDNLKRRDRYVLYVVRDELSAQRTLEVVQTIPFRFATNAQDCEAVAYDPQHDQIILVAKGWEPASEVHALDWPKQAADTLTTKLIGNLEIAGITGLDITADGMRAVVVTYGDAFAFQRSPDETWTEGFSRSGQQIRLPPRKQGESICFAADGRSLLLTSEKRPTPIFRIKCSPGPPTSDLSR